MNMLPIYSFDGLLTSANGVSLEVDCQIQPPFVGGQSAEIRISIPSVNSEQELPDNPCRVVGQLGQTHIELEEIWYRQLHLPDRSRKHASGEVELTHIRSITMLKPWRSKQCEVRFQLSPVFFLRERSGCFQFHDKSQTAEIFRLVVPDLGDVIFSMDWVTEYHRETLVPGGKIHAGYCACVVLKETDIRPTSELVEMLRDALTVLSVLFRQAVAVHGWNRMSPNSMESHWIDPLSPNVAPGEEAKNGDFLAFPNEFHNSAQELVNGHASASSKLKTLVKRLSITVASHIESSTDNRFVAMFSALETVVNFTFKESPESKSLVDADKAFLQHLGNMRSEIEMARGNDMQALVDRADGLIDRVLSRTPSFRLKLTSLLRVYPSLNAYTSDLWPIMGSKSAPGLKDIRDRLAHDGSQGINHQSLAVATWHLSIFIERILFVLLGAQVPKGINFNSSLLSRTGWYERNYWEDLRKRIWER